MKRKAILFLLPILLGAIPLMGLLLFMVGGGEAAKPIATPATVEHAEEYFRIANEIGVPWDLILLIDALITDMEGGEMEDVNPLVSSLNFAYIEVVIEEFESNPDPESSTGGWWHETERYKKYGWEEISSTLGLWVFDNLEALFQRKAAFESQNSNGQDRRCTVYICSLAESEYRWALETYYSDYFDEAMMNDIWELYESKYLYHLYFEEIMKGGGAPNWDDYEMPDVVVGEVTRQELVEVALSLVNLPYLFGGKSPYMGPPVSYLDCSGYVDWVYMQCFGETVSKNMGGVAIQYYNSMPISESELRLGDMAVYWHPAEAPVPANNHIGIYVGEIDGKKAFVHAGGPYWGYPGGWETGRVVVTINDGVTVNNKNPLGGTYPYPAMNPSLFPLYIRGPFVFADDPEAGEIIDEEEEEAA